jgi:hypothetical protein
VDDVVSGRPPCAEWDHVLSGGGMELQNYGTEWRSHPAVTTDGERDEHEEEAGDPGK